MPQDAAPTYGYATAADRSESRPSVPDLVLRAGTLIDGTGADPISPGELVISDGRIVTAGALARPPAEATVVDYGDATILPGLVDAHVHLQFSAGPDHETTRTTHMRASDAERTATAIANAQAALATGVTSLRDTGGYLTLNVQVRDAINSGVVVGPRLLVCGAPITTTAGHLHWCGLRADSASEILKAVRGMAEAGADFIKVMATGGMMTPGSSPGTNQYSDVELHALVHDAHRLHKPVAAHVLGAEGCRLAIDAGVNTLEHCVWLSGDGLHDRRVMDEDAVGRIDPATQAVSVTLTVRFREPVRGLRHLDELPADARDRLRAHGEVYRAMRDRGVPHLISSDAGVIQTYFHEFPLSVIAGAVVLDVTAVEAVHLATLGAAGRIALGDTTGSLEAGKRADILVVQGDLSENICRLSDTVAVYLGGREVARKRRLQVAPAAAS